MKVLVGVHHYPPPSVGGVEVLVERQARWLTGRGHTVEIVCVERIDEPETLTARTEVRDGVTIHRLGLSLAGRNLHLGLRYRDPAVADWFDGLLRHSRPDVFHSQSSYLISASLLEEAQDHGVPTVVTLHDSWSICPRINLLHPDGTRCSGRVAPADCVRCLLDERRRNRLANEARRRVSHWLPLHVKAPFVPGLRPDSNLLLAIADRRRYLDDRLHRADAVISVGRYLYELLLERGFPADRLREIPSGHDFSGWVGLQRSEGRGLRLGYLGQVAAHKGVDLLVSAFRRLVGADEATLTIHGDLSCAPEYVARLRRIANRCPAVRFAGRYENQAAERILSEIDALVVPSVCFETRPLVVMEAFAAGVPVIASDLPNLNNQVRDEVDGLLFRAGDVEHLATQMQRLVDEPDLLDQLRRGIAPVRPLAEEMAEIESLYCGIVEANRSAHIAAVAR